jgi:hypothetical protein
MPKFFTKEQKHEGVRISQKCLLTTTTHQIFTCKLFSLPKGERAMDHHHPDPQDTFKSNWERAIRTIST